MTSPSPAPLTEAEKAAAEALALWHNAHSSTSRLAVAAFEGEARAVVAAVQPIVAAEALQKAEFIIDRQADAKHHNVMHGRSKESFEYIEGIGHASDLVARYRLSLSLPASKETPDA